MPRNPFGWDYPAGAEHDPSAPWNQRDTEQCPECDATDTQYDNDETYEDWYCNECGHTWWVQCGPDPDDQRDAIRDDKLTGDR